jgi:hypothetical protein
VLRYVILGASRLLGILVGLSSHVIRGGGRLLAGGRRLADWRRLASWNHSAIGGSGRLLGGVQEIEKDLADTPLLYGAVWGAREC